jgi:uncharacterized protein YbjQ (UPF0145 family)
MPECKTCGKSIRAWEAVGGACEDCFSLHLQNKARLKQKEGVTERELAQQELDAIILTTETTPNLNITKRIDVISAQAAFEINNFKDLFVGFMNPVKGRSNELEKQLDELRLKSTQGLKAKAHEIGANAVVAIDLDLSTVTIASISMMMMMASGAAVAIEE